MKMIQMVSKMQHEFSGRVLMPGDRFESEEVHVELLVALGRAEVVRVPPGYETRDMIASTPATYPTRDMTSRRLRGKAN